MIKKHSKGRAIIKKDFSGLKIIIPNKIWLIDFILIPFIILYFLIILPEFRKLNFKDLKLTFDSITANPFIIFLIIIFFFPILKSLILMFFGKEIISVDKGYLSIKKSLFGLGFSKKYDIKQIKNMTVVQIQDSYNGKRNFNRYFQRKRIGIINFDYGMKTIKFAYEIEEAEAGKILKLFQQNIYFKEKNFSKNLYFVDNSI